MMELFFDLSNPISIIRFLANFKLELDTNSIHEKAAMSLLPFFVNNAMATTLKSRMSAAAHVNPVVAFVESTEPLI